MPLSVQGPVAFRAQVQQPVMPQVKRDGLVEVTEREVQWDEYVAGLGGAMTPCSMRNRRKLR